MTCSPERVALLAGGDLSPDEASSLAEHLTTCTACRRLLVSLQGDAAELQRMEPALESIAPRMAPRRAPLRWAPAAAILLLLLGLAAAPAVQAMGRVFELFPFLTVRELSEAELAELQRQHPHPDPVTEANKYPRPVPTIEDAEAFANFQVARFDPPSGFIFQEVLVLEVDGGRSVQQVFHHPEIDAFINLHQISRKRNNYVAPEGTVREVNVNGENAVLVTFAPGGVVREWAIRDLHFQWHGLATSLMFNIPPTYLDRYPDEEMIRIAESLR